MFETLPELSNLPIDIKIIAGSVGLLLVTLLWLRIKTLQGKNALLIDHVALLTESLETQKLRATVCETLVLSKLEKADSVSLETSDPAVNVE